jgi:6-phosphogluconolactonase
LNSFELRKFAGDVELAGAAAAEWVSLVQASAKHTVALSGGRIAKAFYQAIVTIARSRAVEFGNVDFFWADERCLPPTDPESNFYLANEHLLQPLKIGEQRVHRLKGEVEGRIAVAHANSEYALVAAPALDLIILGMGEDGHVASLFPNTPDAITSTTDPYLHVSNSPKPPPNRLSLSYTAIAAAKNVWVLASGAGKQVALRESVAEAGKTPLARVLQSRTGTKLFSDIQV